jgi:hypothetical protein
VLGEEEDAFRVHYFPGEKVDGGAPTDADGIVLVKDGAEFGQSDRVIELVWKQKPCLSFEFLGPLHKVRALF